MAMIGNHSTTDQEHDLTNHKENNMLQWLTPVKVG